MEFGLRFESADEEPEGYAAVADEDEEPDTVDTPEEEKKDADVVSLDSFRK